RLRPGHRHQDFLRVQGIGVALQRRVHSTVAQYPVCTLMARPPRIPFASMLYFEAPADESARLHPSRLVDACIERGADRLLIDHEALPAEFFDLSSRVAGDLVHRITLYDIRTAFVLP